MFLVLLCAPACGGQTASGATPASSGADAIAPPPFTATEIRDATRAGRTYRFRMEVAGQPPIIREVAFPEVGERDYVLRIQILDEGNQPVGEAEVERGTWEELITHATWPRAATTIEESSVETPAGRFVGPRYTVTETVEGQEQVTRAHFARDLPGAPVLFEMERGGTLQMKMTLLEHRP